LFIIISLLFMTFFVFCGSSLCFILPLQLARVRSHPCFSIALTFSRWTSFYSRFFPTARSAW
jgi:hypothetical protein